MRCLGQQPGRVLSWLAPLRDVCLPALLCCAVLCRAQSSTNMQLEAWHWLRSRMPYWDRRGGRDHILVRVLACVKMRMLEG